MADLTALLAEEEIRDGRRAFPETQRIFDRGAIEELGRDVAVGWYSTDVNPEEPGFCLVRRGGPYEALRGQFVIFRRGDRRVVLYCLGRAAIPTDIAVTRRAFIGLGLLTAESLPCIVEVGE